jgi:hypothetical protein
VLKINNCEKNTNKRNNENKPKSTIPFKPSPQTMAVVSSTFYPPQRETTIETPLFTNSKPFFGN